MVLKKWTWKSWGRKSGIALYALPMKFCINACRLL